MLTNAANFYSRCVFPHKRQEIVDQRQPMPNVRPQLLRKRVVPWRFVQEVDKYTRIYYSRHIFTSTFLTLNHRRTKHPYFRHLWTSILFFKEVSTKHETILFITKQNRRSSINVIQSKLRKWISLPCNVIRKRHRSTKVFNVVHLKEENQLVLAS